MTTLPDPSKPPRMPGEIMNYKKRRYEVLADDEQGTVKRQHIGPTQRQVSYLKFLCGKHGKKIPDFRHLSKKKVSNLIDMLVKKDLKKWPYGDALPDSIASMTNRSHKIDKMYEWWTKKCADTMKPFDNKAVELLKKKSKRKWKSPDFFAAGLTGNHHQVTYTDAYIKDALKRKFPNTSEEDRDLGLAKCRRMLCLSYGEPTGRVGIFTI